MGCRKDRGDQVGCRKDGSVQSGCGCDRVREKEPVLLALACAFFASLGNSWKLLEKKDAFQALENYTSLPFLR